MKNEKNRGRRHRGSSPPFQDEGQGSFDFMKDAQSIFLNSDSTSESQIHKQQRFKTGKTIDQEINHRQINNVESDQQPLDEGESQKDKDNDMLWKDDGGEGG